MRLRPVLSAYAAGLLVLAAVIALRWSLQDYLSNAPPLVLFLIPVLAAAWAGGMIPGALGLVASGLVGWYYFVAPFGGLELNPTNIEVLRMFLFQGAFVVVIGAMLRRFHLHRTSELGRRLELQASLAKSEMRYRSVVAASSSIVWTTDASGSFVEMQDSWRAFTGQSWEEMKGWGWVNALHPDCRDQLQHQWQRMLTNPKVYDGEGDLWHVGKQQYRHFESRSLPLLDASGRVTEWVGTVTDVHDQMMVARDLLDAKERAEAANKAKSQFLANMSHEIRTPLGAILGFTDLLVEQTTDEDSIKHALTIKRNAEMLYRLVNEVLDMSKVEADRLEVEILPFSLSTFLEEMNTLLGFKAQEKGLELYMKSSGPLPDEVLSDPTRLRQILINVVGNAIKFTEQGRISVTVKATRTPPHSHRLVLSFLVEDTGIGLTDDQKTRLFTPFMQADESMSRRFGGTGLGLYLSRRLAALLGGDLQLLESHLGQGSVFRVTINTRTPEASTAAEQEVEIAKAPTQAPIASAFDLHGIEVLLVEDAVDNQVLVGRVLQNVGARVEMASNGFDGIDKAMSRHFDLILMDIQMPQLDGFEATKQLRQRGYKHPIVALTAHAMKSDRDRCLEVGCDDYLSKPFEGKSLVGKVAWHVGRAVSATAMPHV